MKRYIIIDGLNFFIRSFTVNPTMDVNGAHIGGFLGFLMGLNKLIRENNPTDVLVIWDGEGGSLKRRSMYKDYKAGRKPKLNRQYDFENVDEQIVSFAHQINMLNEYLDYLPVTAIKINGLEADDVIAYLCNLVLDNEDQKIIVSTDKDFYQLLSNNVTIYVPTKKKYITIKELKDTVNILPENFILMKALMGDNSDNVKGIKGIGEKTVIKLFPFLSEKICELKDIFNHADENKDKNIKYKSIISQREIIINNVSIMQLSSQSMNPLFAKIIRQKALKKDTQYKPTAMRIQLTRDGIQLNVADFFVNFKDFSNKKSILQGK